MADIINLRQARKRKARAEKEQRAAQNRARSGRTKAAKQRDALQKRLDDARLDGARITPEPDGVAPSPCASSGVSRHGANTMTHTPRPAPATADRVGCPDPAVPTPHH